MITIIQSKIEKYRDSYDNSSGSQGYSLPIGTLTKKVYFLGIRIWNRIDNYDMDSVSLLNEKGKPSIGYGSKK